MRKPSFLLVFLLASVPVRGEILKVEIDDVITQVTADFIEKAVAVAGERDAEFLLIRINTPGGLGISMNEIIQQILNSKVPIVCYVAPGGSRAASAGFYILLAADVAAMTPGTNTGAATPIFQGGGADETLLRKAKNDALASLRSVAEQRNRNSKLAETAVTDAASFTENEALEGNLIDIVAQDEADLMAQLDGREIVRFNGEKGTLKTQGVTVTLLAPTFGERLLAHLANPVIAALLGSIGMLGLYFEFSNPGAILPGVVGAICLLLALVGASFLPINWIGAALLLLALGLFIAEVKVQGFGILGIGGGIALFLGLIMLIDTPIPEMRIGMGYALGITLGFVSIMALLMYLAMQAFRAPIAVGNEAMVGALAEARSDIGERGGKVFLQGEWWNAYSPTPIPQGTRVRVVGARNLTLQVEPLDSASFSSESTSEEEA